MATYHRAMPRPDARPPYPSSRAHRYFVAAMVTMAFAADPVSSSSSSSPSETSASLKGAVAARRSRGMHPGAKATAERFRRGVFRPYDEASASGHRIDYGGRHPFELLEQRRRREEQRRGGDIDSDGDDGANSRREGGAVRARARRSLESFGGANPRDTLGAGALDSEKIEYALENAHHAPLRIRFVTDALEAARGKSDEKDRKIDVLEERVLPAIAAKWARSLSVVPVADHIPVSSDACWGFGSRGGDIDVHDADIAIIVDVAVDEELACTPGGNNALAVAAPCHMDQWDRPIIGLINICLERDANDRYDEDVDLEEEIADLIAIGTHEAAHSLGMVDELIKYWRNPQTGSPMTPRTGNWRQPFAQEQVTCVDGAVRYEKRPSREVLAEGFTANGARYYEIVTPRLAAVVRNQFDCQALKGARLENQPTSSTSCFGSHLDERLFFTELMGPVYSDFSNALSAVTMAYFEDSSWYVANYTAAEPSTFGHGAGCDFVYKDCIVDGEVPEYSKGFFCNQQISISSAGYFEYEGLTCDPSRTHKAVCDLGPRDEIPGLTDTNVPGPFQYFPEDQDMAAFSMYLADFCPIATVPYMDCQDSSNSESSEYFGADSRCYDITIDSTQGTFPNSMCFKTICNAAQNRVELDVRGSRIVCDYDGQTHSLRNFVGNIDLECPRFAVVCPDLVCPVNCAGRGRCNWDSGKCECFDAADTSPDCFGGTAAAPEGTFVGQPIPTTTTTPRPQTPTSNGDGSSSDPTGPTFTIPDSIFKTEPTEEPTRSPTGTTRSPTDKPEYDGPIIVLGPGRSAASTSSLTFNVAGTCLSAFGLVLALLT